MNLIYPIIVVSALMFFIKDKYSYLINCQENFFLSSVFMFFSALPVLVYFEVKLDYTILLLIVSLTGIGHLIILPRKKLIKKFLQKNNNYMDRMDPRFLVAKFVEVVWQQSFVYAFVGIALSVFSRSYATMMIFAACFMFAHLITFFFVPFKRAMIYTFLSFFGGLLFSYLIMFSSNGFWYSLLTHYTFYIILGIYSDYNLTSVFNINQFKLSDKGNKLQ